MRKSIPNSTQNEYWSPVVPVFDLGFFIQERREPFDKRTKYRYLVDLEMIANFGFLT